MACAAVGLAYLGSFAWTPAASADAVRALWWGRLRGEGEELYLLGRQLERGARRTTPKILASASFQTKALLEFGLEPAGGQSPVMAEWAYLAAARAGSGAAMLREAEILSASQPPRPSAVSAWLRRASEAGEGEAMWRYASRLRSGIGCEADPLEAAAWCRRGAEAGNPRAMYLLAQWLEIGSAGVAQDPAAALRWYLASAKLGHRYAGASARELLRRYPELEQPAPPAGEGR